MKKEINVYNNNMPSGLSMFYHVAKKEGVKINRVEDLESLEDSNLTLIVTTGPSANWSIIKNYVNGNQNTRIWIMDWSTSKEEIETLIGKNKNVEYIMTKETRMQEDLYGKMLNKLGVNC